MSPVAKPSIIFNQYAKKAVEKGWLKNSNLKKEASTKIISPTGDDSVDFPILISLLRNKGMYKQAAALEEKFLIYKEAETHLYKVHEEEGEDFLNFAHPEKKFEVAKAENSNGAISSLLEKQNKMLSVVNKKPTGKYAELIHNVIARTAEILHPEIAKFAQKNVILDEEESTEDIITELNVDPETKKNIDSANSLIAEKLSENFSNIENALKSTGLTEEGLAEFAVLTEEKILKNVGIDFYLKANNLDKSKFQTYINVFYRLFPDGNQNVESIVKLIYSLKSFNEMLNFFNSIDTRVADQWFGGSEIKGVNPNDADSLKWLNEKAQTDKRYQNRPLSVWVVNFVNPEDIKLNGAKVNFAAQGILGWMEKWKTWFIDQTKIDNANKAFVAQTKPIFDAIKTTGATLAPDAFISKNKIRKTVGLAVGALKNGNAAVQKIIDFVNKQKMIYNQFGLIGYDQSIISFLTNFNKNISSLVEEISKLSLNSVLDHPINGVIASSIASTFKEIGVLWSQYFESDKIKDEDKPIVENNLKQAKNIFNIISKNYDKPWAYLQQFILPLFPKATTPQILLQIGQDALKYVKNIVPKTASQIDNITKLADFGTLSGKPSSSSSSSKSGVQTSFTGNPALAKANLNDPVQLAVANMQLALNIFGQLISNPDNKSKFPKANFDPNDGLRIIGTGPKANPHLNMFDGHWGPNTDAALNLANKYLSSIGKSLLTGVKWNQSTRSHSSGTEEAAKINSALLSKIISYIKGEKSNESAKYLDSTILDSLPEMIEWNSDPGQASLSNEQQTVKLTKGNLSSLKALYDFLTKNHLREAEVSGASETEIGTEGFTPKSWNVVFQWFQRRAVLKYNSAKALGEDAINQAREYFNSIKRLSNIYDKMLSTYSKYIKEDTVVNPGLIDEFSRKIQSGEISSEKGNLENPQIGTWLATKKKIKNKESNELDLNGERIKSPKEPSNTLPFADTINFRDEELFSDFDTKNINSPVIRLGDMQKIPGSRMAQQLFAGSVSEKIAQKAAIQLLGQNPTKWNNNENVWYVQNQKTIVPATDLLSEKDIAQMTQKIIQNAPITKYRTFLNNLSTKIHDVMQEWSEGAPENLIVRLSDYYKYWQQAIQKQLRDLVR